MITSSAMPAGQSSPAATERGADLPMSAPISSNLALYQIEQRLSELLEMRNTAVEEGAAPAELEAIDKLFEEYFLREVKKVDGICHALHAFDKAAGVALAESERLYQRGMRLRAQYDRIKAATLKAMQDHGVRVLETPTNKLRVQANGGLEPLEVTETDNIPIRLLKRTVTLNGPEMAALKIILTEFQPGEDTAITKAVASLCHTLADAQVEPDNNALREALKRGEEVPGAKLLPRGFHLRIE